MSKGVSVSFPSNYRWYKNSKEVTAYRLRIKGYEYKGKSTHDLGYGLIDKTSRERIRRYVLSVLAWNATGRQLHKEMDEANQQVQKDDIRLYKFLSGLGLLEKESDGTVEQAIGAYENSKDKLGSTVGYVRDVWKQVESITGPKCKLSKINAQMLREIYDSITHGDLSKKEDGSKHSEAYIKTRLSCITRVMASAKKAGLISVNPCEKVVKKEFSKDVAVRDKEYISIERFNYIYDLYNNWPDIQLFLVQMYTIGSRPGEAHNFDTWEDIEWNAEGTWPLYFNRHYSKTAKDVDKKGEHKLGQVRVAIPYRFAQEIVKYRDALLMWETDYPDLFTHRNKYAPPVWNKDKNSFTGRLYCVRSFKHAYLQIAKAEGFADQLPKALPTALRASCSSHIFDLGGAKHEKHYLQHDEKARTKHYIGPLSDRPEMFNRPEGNFLVLYKELFDVGTEEFYSRYNNTDEVLRTLTPEYLSKAS